MFPTFAGITLEGTVGGTFKAPAGTVRAPLADGSAKEIPVERLEVRGGFAGKSAQLDELVLELGGATVRAEGTLDDGGRLTGAFSLGPAPLSLALQAADLRGETAGHLRLRGQVEGELNDPTVTAQVESEGLALAGTKENSAPAAAPVAPLDCQVTWHDLAVDGLRRLTEAVARTLDENDQEVSGLDSALSHLGKLADRPQGVLAGRAAFAGSLRDPAVRDARLDFTDGHLGSEPLPALSLAGGFEQGVITCDSLDLLLNDFRTKVSGQAKLDGEADLTVNIHQLPLALVNPWTRDAPDISGLADLTVRVTGPTKKPHLEGALEVAEPAMRNAVLDRVQVKRFVLEEGALTIDPDGLEITRQDNPLVAGGRLPFSYEAPVLDRTKPFEAAARVAHGDLRLLRGFLPAMPTIVGGWQADLVASGTLEKPDLRGHVGLQEASMVLPGLESNLHGLTGEIRLEPGRRAVIDGLTATLNTAPVGPGSPASPGQPTLNTTTVLSSGQVSDRPETLDRKVSKGCESTGF
ncbi:MAG: hypothetical protein GW802_12935, partial [Armatimonadetes bacterium]|nr:hypothetical protein [Armatimonadota bacterium]